MVLVAFEQSCRYLAWCNHTALSAPVQEQRQMHTADSQGVLSESFYSEVQKVIVQNRPQRRSCQRVPICSYRCEEIFSIFPVNALFFIATSIFIVLTPFLSEGLRARQRYVRM
jgi:hypothetical protein